MSIKNFTEKVQGDSNENQSLKSIHLIYSLKRVCILRVKFKNKKY